jgi:hypothetical protein
VSFFSNAADGKLPDPTEISVGFSMLVEFLRPGAGIDRVVQWSGTGAQHLLSVHAEETCGEEPTVDR